MSDIAIRLDHVTKRFKLYHNMITGPVKELLCFWKRHSFYNEFLAVKDVSLEVERGSIVGILGPNGAGKTTLLKMIAGLLPVDGGQITVNGRITALLALGVGVHPEFTGRENIIYGGMLLGMSKREVMKKMGAIIEFAELGDYIDRPFRTFSSGMRARLLFSISMSVDPDILIVDEALATGDSYFVQKCAGRIQEICHSGATILFVSHNLSQIETLCEKAALLIDGEIKHFDTSANTIAHYNQWLFQQESHRFPNFHTSLVTGGSGELRIDAIDLLDENGNPATGFYWGKRMDIKIHYTRLDDSVDSVFAFLGILHAQSNAFVGEMASHRILLAPGKPQAQECALQNTGILTIRLDPLLLQNNHYKLWIQLYKLDPQRIFCESKGLVTFFVGMETALQYRDVFFSHPAHVFTDASGTNTKSTQ